MKTRIIQLVFVALGVVLFNWIGCQPSQEHDSVITPSLPIPQGVSAPFAGFIGQWMLVGGGCNFPTIAAADGGKKVYYTDVFACNTESDNLTWDLHSDFSFPIGYGASVETTEGLICIGGMNETSSLKNVFRIGINQQQQLTIVSLPSLPESIDNATATCIGNQLYVTGGNQGEGGNSLYTFCLDKDTIWTKLSAYPGPKRIQPVLLASENALYLFGGFQVDQETKEAVISSNFLVYDAKENTWSAPQSIPSMKDGSERALVGCAGTRVGDKLLLAGGVNYEIFKAALEGKAPKDYMKRPVEWYQFSKDLLVYDVQTKEWTVVPDVEGFNKAGGSLLYHKGSLFMVCGETKPGIRTSEIVKKDLNGLLSSTSIR